MSKYFAWLQMQGCLATKGRQGFVKIANTKQKARLKSKKVLANGEGGEEFCPDRECCICTLSRVIFPDF